MWEKIVTNLAGQLTQPQYEGWVKVIKFIEADEANIYVAVPNEYYKNWINKNLSAQINTAIQQETGKNLLLTIKVQPEIYENESAKGVTSGIVPEGDSIIVPVRKDKENIRLYNQDLNLKYTFDSFVVGATNRFVYTIAKTVGENPGKKYNPFFLYGGVGLGKTHLMQAIGHQVYRKYPGSKIRYLSVEKFTNELIESIRLKRTETFRSTYRQIDLLLLDDVQFLKGKENTQEEIFNTFNALYEAGKQIVLSSDRPPKQILGLEERLVSRFEWGMMADIKAPDLETRIAILRNKAKTDKMNIPDDVLELIATAYQNNIRELEGTLNRVVAYVGITGCPMNVESVRGLIEDTSKAKP
jgi:chromosomal replication initiator protein